MATAWRVPPLWAGETCCIIASGPSLTREDVDACRGKARVIVVNDNYLLAPWADLLYFCDGERKWYGWHKSRPQFQAFKGLRVTMNAPDVAADPMIKMIDRDDKGGVAGLSDDPTRVRTGRNSGYQAIGLAIHLGVKRIILLGYDMKASSPEKSHWFGDHPVKANLAAIKGWIKNFDALAEPLKARGVEVINCTRDTALDCFPKMALADALSMERRVAEPAKIGYYRPVEADIIRIPIPAVKLVKYAKQLCEKKGQSCPNGRAELWINPASGPELVIHRE